MKFKSEVQLEALNNATVDTDKFLVSDSTTVKYRTGSEVLSDIGAVSSVTATGPITSTGGATPNISTLIHTNKLVGRSTTGTGTMEEISIGSGLALSGGTLSSSALSGSILHGIAAGTDTYTVTITGATAYADGDAYLINFTNGNTTSATLNINGQGAIALWRNNDGPLIGGDIVSGGEILCVYRAATNVFQCIGTAPNTLLAYVTNAETSTITKGQAVYVSGGTGDRIKVKLAYNTSDATSAQTIGIVQSTSIAANQKGLIIVQGQLDNLSLFPTATWADGDFIYLGATPGTLTNVKPFAPNHLVYLGYVTTASNGSAGRMYVKVQNGYEMNEIHDVYINPATLANGDLLQYNSSTDLWENESLSTAGIQAKLNGTGFVKASGTTISYDNTTYYPYPTGTTSQYVRGDGSLATFPTIPSTPTLDQVLTAGNTSQIDANVGIMGLYDITNSNYSYITGDRNRINFYSDPTTRLGYFGNNIIVLDNNPFIISIKGPDTLTGNRTVKFPDATGTVALTSDIHASVTIGTANGLSLIGQQLSLGLSSSSANGALSSTDWTTFNNKVGSADNGLTLSGTVVKLGGTLLQNTSITGGAATAYNLTLTDGDLILSKGSGTAGTRGNLKIDDDRNIFWGGTNHFISGSTVANEIGYTVPPTAKHNFSSNIKFRNYGAGTKTGTAAYNLAVTSAGDIIETTISGGSTPIKLTSQTLAVGSWTLSGGYYTYSFSNANIDTTCDVSVTPQNASYQTAYNANILPFVGVAAGVATFYSQFPPQANIVVDIVITQTT
jgi:hypothetical protein